MKSKRVTLIDLPVSLSPYCFLSRPACRTALTHDLKYTTSDHCNPTLNHMTDRRFVFVFLLVNYTLHTFFPRLLIIV